jgi:twitching motility protein PilT
MSQSPIRQKQNLALVGEGGEKGTVEGNSSHSAKIDMKYLVRALVKYNASDLHVKVGRPPLFRVNGELIPSKMSPLTSEDAEKIIFGVLSSKQISELEKKRSIDLSFHVNALGRFRCNVYFQKGTVSAAVRMIPIAVPNIDSLGVPAVLKELCHRPKGLLIVTGATGSGKSTTLAAMIQHINETQHSHVLAIEDPIEFVYKDLKSSITQREVGSDTPNIKEALLAGLRQDPDIIMIGEIREPETIQAALTAAETGHLVITTLHTNDAKSSIDRILDIFKGDSQNQVRIQLASTLIGVISQQLLLRKDGGGRIPACEVMVKSPVIENYILNNQLDRIQDAIGNSTAYYKMQSMNQALEKLILSESISLEEALKASPSPDDLKLSLSGVQRSEGYSPVS